MATGSSVMKAFSEVRWVDTCTHNRQTKALQQSTYINIGARVGMYSYGGRREAEDTQPRRTTTYHAALGTGQGALEGVVGLVHLEGGRDQLVRVLLYSPNKGVSTNLTHLNPLAPCDTRA
jgi:hypothetical protein